MNLSPAKQLRVLVITCIATYFTVILPAVKGKMVTETKYQNLGGGFCGRKDPPDTCENGCKSHYYNVKSWKCERYNTGIPKSSGGSDFLSAVFTSSYVIGRRCICKTQTQVIIEEMRLPECVNHCRIKVPFEGCQACCRNKAKEPWSSEKAYCDNQKRNDPTSAICTCVVRKEYQNNRKPGNNRSRNLRSPPALSRKRSISRRLPRN